MTHPDLTAIDSETLRLDLAEAQLAEADAIESRHSAHFYREKMSDMVAAYHKARRTIENALNEREGIGVECDLCGGVCERGQSVSPRELSEARSFFFDFEEYADLAVKAHVADAKATTNPDAGKRAFAIKRELIRRGDWP